MALQGLKSECVAYKITSFQTATQIQFHLLMHKPKCVALNCNSKYADIFLILKKPYFLSLGTIWDEI